MPLVRIDLAEGRSQEHRDAIGSAVYEALIGVGVPENDRFQIFGEHAAGTFVFDKNYLGIARSDALIIIQITWNEGRDTERKKALYRAIVDNLAASPGVRPEDVLINLVDVPKENWSFGLGEAQYAD